MWKYKIWKGGDAKLFFAFVFLLPLSTYSNNYIDIFPALVLLINIFIPLAVFFVGRLIILSPKKTRLNIIKEIKKDFIIEIIILIGISWGLSLLTNTISNTFGIVSNTTLAILIYFFVRRAISGKIKRFRNKYKKLTPLFIFFVFIIITILIFQNIQNPQALINKLKSLIFIVLAYILFRIFMIVGESKKSSKEKRTLEVSFAPAIFLGTILTIINNGFFYNIILALLNQ